jgi:AcrR family transcriptional regulator
MNPTRQRILDTAEVCFAQRGYDGTSLREITRQADVNLGAVNYHFGSKAGLFDEVLRRRVEPLNRRRLDLLNETIARHAPDPAPLEEMLEAYLRPPVEAFSSPARATLVRLLHRVHEGNHDPEQFEELFGEVQRRFMVVREVLEPMSEREFQGRLRFVIGGMLHVLADQSWSGSVLGLETIVTMLVRWGASALRASAIDTERAAEMEGR